MVDMIISGCPSNVLSTAKKTQVMTGAQIS
jgi:hypothetical protein